MSRNVIVGCESTKLSPNELSLFNELKPWGLILFSRNISEPNQVKDLISQFADACGREKTMVLIDQEGGRVSRLPGSHWRIPPSPTVFATLFEKDQALAKRACYLNAKLTGLELKALGINVNCAPMLDVAQANANPIISERALGAHPTQVIALAEQICAGLKQAGIAPVIKHIPGHGRATSDSHLDLPTVDATLAQLTACDFSPFKAMRHEAMAMTAHIVYSHISTTLPATLNKTIITHIIRDTIGFDGLLMTDDINMQALSGDISSRASEALRAGCDVVLHCSGNFEEMRSLLAVTSTLKDKALERAKKAESIAFQTPEDTQIETIKHTLEEILA